MTSTTQLTVPTFALVVFGVPLVLFAAVGILDFVFVLMDWWSRRGRGA